jgi:signal-transduction protein with cAMP-binding, CBS, and nucleotidyltransferase domain
MNLKSVMVPTEVASAGMTVRQVFEECLRVHTPGLPFCDDHGVVTGRVTLKYILKRQYLPEHLIEMARVLGENVSDVEDIELLAKQLFENRIDSYLQRPHASLTSASSIIKALALMEKLDTGYLFVIDEGQYMGVVTLQILSKAILQHDNSSRSI